MTEKAWTWRHAILQADIPATTKHVLLTISCFMNEVGEGCYRSTKEISKCTSLSERAVCTHIEKAAELGWLEVSKHGFKGQKWKRHDYRAAWPKGTERGSAASEKALNEVQEGTEPDDQKALNEVQRDKNISKDISNPSPLGAQARGGGDFDMLWSVWPEHHRPDSREAAQTIFSKLSSADQVMAVNIAKTFIRACVLRKQRPLMVKYLRQSLFAEFYDAPPLDEDGLFKITPDRPEWSEWLGAIRSEYGEPGVQSTIRHKIILRKSRWPVPQPSTVAAE